MNILLFLGIENVDWNAVWTFLKTGIDWTAIGILAFNIFKKLALSKYQNQQTRKSIVYQSKQNVIIAKMLTAPLSQRAKYVEKVAELDAEIEKLNPSVDTKAIEQKIEELQQVASETIETTTTQLQSLLSNLPKIDEVVKEVVNE